MSRTAKHPQPPANNMALMAAIGTQRWEGYTPMPPRQHLSFMDFRESEEVRVVAWLWSVTIQKGKGKKAWGYARDKRGVLTLKHMAADLNMELSNASDAMKRTIEKGRARKDDEGRFWLCGNVPEPQLCSSEDDGEEKPKPQLKLIRTNKLKEAWDVYLQGLDEKQRQQRESDLEKIQAYREKLNADAIALARDAGDQVLDQYFGAIAFVPPEETRGRDPKPRDSSSVQLSLLNLPELSVQIKVDPPQPDSVQKPNGIPYKGETDSAQINASLLNSQGIQGTQGKKNSIHPSSSSFPMTFAAVDEYATADDDATRQLVKACRKERPDATDSEIAHLVHGKGRQARRAMNPMGFLLTAVPKCFVGEPFEQYRAKRAQEQAAQAEAEARYRTEEERRAADLHALLADPNVPEKEKAMIRRVLGVQTQAAGGS